MLFQILYCK